MGFGIGGGGYMGIALEVLLPPVQSALATAASGGTITAGTYKYVVTAINGNGETNASNEQTIVTTGSTSTVTVTWAAVTGATGYKLYKTAAGGGTGTELLYKTVGVVTTDIDTTPGTPTGAFPTANTASAPNTYVAPTKFFPFLSESFRYVQETTWRRPIRQNIDNMGGVAGNVRCEGDLEMECLEDVLVYFAMCSRLTVVRTGTTPNWIYTCTPNSNAVPTKTMSITIVRNGIVFGYVGVVVGSYKLATDAGMLKYSCTLMGSDETVQTLPTPTFTSVAPFGAGTYNIQVPTPTQVFDMDTFEFNVEDNPEAQYRLKDTGRGAQFIKLGERTSTLTTARDFQDRTDYDAYKALTAQSISLSATKSATNLVQITIPAAIKDSYELGLSGQGDLIRAAITYQNTFDFSASRAYQLVIKTQETVA
jgi:hypothetical protein